MDDDADAMTRRAARVDSFVVRLRVSRDSVTMRAVTRRIVMTSATHLVTLVSKELMRSKN